MVFSNMESRTWTILCGVVRRNKPGNDKPVSGCISEGGSLYDQLCGFTCLILRGNNYEICKLKSLLAR